MVAFRARDPGPSQGLLGFQSGRVVLDAPTEQRSHYSLLQEDGQKSTKMILPDSGADQSVSLPSRVS